MAVIQKIRNKYAKLAGFVIALSLVGFILMDAASGRFGDLFGNDTSVVKVNGEKIDVKEYVERKNEYEILYRYSSQGRPLDDATRAQIDDQALRELVNQRLIEKECEKLGIRTTKEEEKELIYGANPDPIVRQYPIFTNEETRMFDPSRIKMFEQQVDQIDPSGKAREEWETIKSFVLRNNLVRKYNTLMMRSVNLPEYAVKNQLKDQASFASIRYVKVPFATINDAEVKVSEQEMTDYMKKREAMYRIDEPTRSAEYVTFDVTPSSEDTGRALGTLNQIRSEFAATQDAESFVNRNSDEPYSNAFMNKKTFMSAYSDSIISTPVGGVYGPYYENGNYKLTKIVEKQNLPDSSKVRHILIKSAERGQMLVADSIAKKRIDSIVAVINSGVSFDSVVRLSQDESSVPNGGVYTFTLQQRPQISKEFGDFAFDGTKGQKKTVKVENEAYAGYHYIEILEQSGFAPAVKMATITKSLFPGDNTENATYAQASEFAGQNRTEKAFDEAVKKQSLNKRVADNIKVNDFMVPGLGASRELIRFMYEGKVGDVSQVINLDGRYVVAKITSVQETGLMKLDANLRPVIEAAVRNEKKAKMLADKYKNVTSLEALAQSAGQQVLQADSFNASQPFIPNLGFEPKVVGYTFYANFKPATISPVIKGQDGIYYISLLSRNIGAAPADVNIVKQMRNMQRSQLTGTISGSFEEMMRNRADIKYTAKNL